MREMTANYTNTQRLNAILGILGIFTLGIFLDWFPKVILQLPLPSNPVARSLFNSTWQTGATIVIPFIWAINRLGFSFSDLGLSTRNLAKSILLGCALYSLALAAFLHCSDDPLIVNHAVRNASGYDAVGFMFGMCITAAGTDLATRGFILLALSRYTHVVFAIVAQNLTWFLGHISEINLLSNCLGFGWALGLTLTLGLLGDAVALRTRNVVGLALAHVLLNVVLVVYIRQL